MKLWALTAVLSCDSGPSATRNVRVHFLVRDRGLLRCSLHRVGGRWLPRPCGLVSLPLETASYVPRSPTLRFSLPACRVIKSLCGVRRFDFQADHETDEKLAAIKREACCRSRPLTWGGWFVLWFNIMSMCLGISMVAIGVVALALPAAVTVAVNVFRVSSRRCITRESEGVAPGSSRAPSHVPRCLSCSFRPRCSACSRRASGRTLAARRAGS